ncbi:hypothetical protein Poli38472_000442 [Pythium oligandrum]|uniref:ATP-dependent DNA helicase n=1 Tax=Pythium oligandrum TaxID=41045 RepID=A0A8K1CC49_PYTOL|nr:hypothetical protein Poli38472_000442 [Pythium oligandrum]|eukprot:TMW60400.1 hypothetical protein Poli38472_000442 [Pythium oligandrum]
MATIRWRRRRALSLLCASYGSKRCRSHSALPSLEAACALVLGEDAPRISREQALAVEHAVHGYSVFVHLPTGAGKSLAFQAPALMTSSWKTTLVVSPLLALMHDQVANLTRKGVPAVQVSAETSRRKTPLLTQLADKRLVYTTPEFLLQNSEMRAWLQELARREALARLVLDEAHCLLEWGNTFRPTYLELSQWKTRCFPHVPVTLATATIADDDIARLAELFHAQLQRPNDVRSDTDAARHAQMVLVQQIADRTNLKMEVVRKVEGQTAAFIQQRVGEATAIVYCLTRLEAEQVCLELVRLGCRAGVYHGGLPRKRREFVRKQWMGGQLSIICATSAFGMGIDRADVRFVVHHSLPLSIASYYQQIGRAGRDGQLAECLLLYAPEDKQRASAITTERLDLDMMQEPTVSTGSSYLNIEEMAAFCESSDCRREQLFTHFGYNFEATTCPRACNCGPLVDGYVTEALDESNAHEQREDFEASRGDDIDDEDSGPAASQVEYYYQKVLAEARRQKLPKRETLSRRAIREILRTEPQTIEEMAMIRGVGHDKATRYFYTFSFR